MDLQPLPLTLTPNRRTQWKHLVVMILMVLLGAAAVYWRFEPTAGWVLLALGAVLTPVAVVQLLPGAASLTLDQEGFHVTAMYRRQSYRWDEIEAFGTYEPTPKKPAVGFNFLPGRRPDSLLMRTSRKELGYEAGLADVYELAPAELAALLNAYLERHAPE